MAIALKLFVVVENPLNSLLFHYWAMGHVFSLMDAKRISLRLSTFGADSTKPLELWGNAPWLGDLKAKGKAAPKVLKRLAKSKARADGGKSVTGCKVTMTNSAAYTKQFGDAVADLQQTVLKPNASAKRKDRSDDFIFDIMDE